MPKSRLKLETSTLWGLPVAALQRGEGRPKQGLQGGTPAHIIWNLLMRYARPNDLVLDPICGSGATLDVVRDPGRLDLVYDLAPTRKDIFRTDALRSFIIKI